MSAAAAGAPVVSVEHSANFDELCAAYQPNRASPMDAFVSRHDGSRFVFDGNFSQIQCAQFPDVPTCFDSIDFDPCGVHKALHQDWHADLSKNLAGVVLHEHTALSLPFVSLVLPGFQPHMLHVYTDGSGSHFQNRFEVFLPISSDSQIGKRGRFFTTFGRMCRSRILLRRCSVCL